MIEQKEPRNWTAIALVVVGIIGIVLIVIASGITLIRPSQHDVMRSFCDRAHGQWVEGSREYYCIYPSSEGR